MKNSKIVIIGGGLAGLTAAIHLGKKNIKVTIVEKNEYPKHKVCGEYISNEVIPYLSWLNISLQALQVNNITELQFSDNNGDAINTILPLGGFGVSRYKLDNYLFTKAIGSGAINIKDEVIDINFKDDKFTINLASNSILEADIVIGAFGKRSNIDINLNRPFIKKKSNWLAVKAHYKGNFKDNLVGLHNFKGGYCGVSKVEDNTINICYLVDFENFKKHKNIDEFENAIVKSNPILNNIFNTCEMIFDKPLTISQISFKKKAAVENHILMIGDTAGLIHPLCGNGMAMAIHSAKIVSELIENFENEIIKSREQLENEYSKIWNFHFKKRIKTGFLISKILKKPKLASIAIQFLSCFPLLLRLIIKKTHGKTIQIPN